MSFFETLRRRFQKQNINKETDEKQFSKLSSLFIKNPQKAIEKASQYLIKSKKKISYEQFINEIKSTQHTSFCSFSWTKPTLCAQCLDCQKQESSCFCIPCFLSGHHDQHNSRLFSAESGCCDCGNPSFINPSGFCSNHPGPDPNPDITQMTPENRTKFITVFKSAYYGAMNSTSENNMIECIKYISQFIPYGDGLRRCASYAIVILSKEYLYKNVIKMTENMIQALIDLFGQLVSDFYFMQKMSFLYYQNFPYVSQTLGKYLIDHNYTSDYERIKLFDSISFHYFSMLPVTYSITKKGFNWPDFLVNIIEISMETLIKSGYEYDQNYEANTIYRIKGVSSYLWAVLTLDDQHSKIQEFIDKYSTLLVKYEGILSFYARTIPEDDDDSSYNSDILMEMFGILNSYLFLDNKYKSPKNKQFSITKVVLNLFQFCKMKNVSPDSVFDSKKMTKVSTNLPLHNLLFCLLQNFDDIKSVINNECRKNQLDIQQFCSLVSIYPLRVLASFFCSGKFAHLNRGNICSLKALQNLPFITFNCYFGLVQILLGICPNKEEFLKNILSTFGCFDDLNEFKKKLNETDYGRQVFLSNNVELDAGIFIMSLLTDHSILSLDKNYFNLIRVIELLKKSHPTSNEIQEYINENLIDSNFNEMLLDHIERVSSKKGSGYFTLKNEGDFTPFFPLIHVNDRMKLLANYSEKLIPILDYEELPKGISLKDCFRLPSFVSLTFKILSLNNMTQVGFAMLISLVKNGEKFSPQSFKAANPISIKAENLKSFISQLENSQVDLSRVNLLTINAQLEDKDPTTLMKLVLSNKSLGNLAVEKAELPVDTAPEQDKFNDVIREKKAKAALFKQRLMKEYQNKRKQFGVVKSEAVEQPNQETKKETTKEEVKETTNDDNDDDNDELNKESENDDVVCSFCLSKQDDVFGFPCLSLPTTLPSIIEKKCHGSKSSLTENEITYSMNICRHPIHFKCYKELQNEGVKKMSIADIMAAKTPVFQCTIDRGNRNCFLPLFQTESDDQDAFKTKPSKLMKEAIDDFIKQAFYHRAESDIIVPIVSFVGTILKLEVRHRKRPECLDSRNVQLLLRNLFLTLYHGLHEKAKTAELGKKIKDPLTKLVYSIIQSENPIKDFCYYVQIASSDLDGIFMYEFLRRCAIIEDFAVKNTVSNRNFIDWDDVLSFNNLLLRFHVAVEYDADSIELPLFEIFELPEKFIGLCMNPFNFDLSDQSVVRAVDLMTGIVCTIPSDTNQKATIDEHCKKVYNGGLAMFLILTGDNASNVFFYASNIKKQWYIEGFYIDKFGDVDPGFKRGVITTLSKDRLENSLDVFLSGEVVLF